MLARVATVLGEVVAGRVHDHEVGRLLREEPQDAAAHRDGALAGLWIASVGGVMLLFGATPDPSAEEDGEVRRGERRELPWLAAAVAAGALLGTWLGVHRLPRERLLQALALVLGLAGVKLVLA